MAKSNGWKTEIDISDLYLKYKTGDMGIREVAREFAERLRENEYAKDLTSCIYVFDLIAENKEREVDGLLYLGESLADLFDEILSDVYDFGDSDNKILIITESAPYKNHRNLIGDDRNRPPQTEKKT